MGPDVAHPALDSVQPVGVGVGLIGDLVEDEFEDAVNQVVAVLHVAVHGHGGEPDAARNVRHGERADSLLVE